MKLAIMIDDDNFSFFYHFSDNLMYPLIHLLYSYILQVMFSPNSITTPSAPLEHHHQQSVQQQRRQINHTRQLQPQQQRPSSATPNHASNRSAVSSELAAELYQKYGLVPSADMNTFTVSPDLQRRQQIYQQQQQQMQNSHHQSQETRAASLSGTSSLNLARPTVMGRGNFHLYQQRQASFSKNGKVPVTSPHSGHFMTSNLDDDEDSVKGMGKGLGVEEPDPSNPEILRQLSNDGQTKAKGYNFSDACLMPKNTYRFNSTFNKKDANDFDSSLSKLFACMTLAYGR